MPLDIEQGMQDCPRKAFPKYPSLQKQDSMFTEPGTSVKKN
jgi:hypothetical protein